MKNQKLFEELASRFAVVHHDDSIAIFTVPPTRSDDRGALYVPTDIHPRWPHVASVPIAKAGQARGRHCHRGDDPAKNPEASLFVAGMATLTWAPVRIPEGSELYSSSAELVGEKVSIELAPGMLVVIEPSAYHEIVAKVDNCMIAELMMTPNDVNLPDVFRLIAKDRA